jgi:hypothetical protein
LNDLVEGDFRLCHHAGDAVQARELFDSFSKLYLGVLMGECDAKYIGDVLIEIEIMDREKSLIPAFELQQSYTFFLDSDRD